MARFSGAVGAARWRGLPDYLTGGESSGALPHTRCKPMEGVPTMSQGE